MTSIASQTTDAALETSPACPAMDAALTTQSLISKILKAGDDRTLPISLEEGEEKHVKKNKKEKNLLTRNYIILLMKTNQLCIRFAQIIYKRVYETQRGNTCCHANTKSCHFLYILHSVVNALNSLLYLLYKRFILETRWTCTHLLLLLLTNQPNKVVLCIIF